MPRKGKGSKKQTRLTFAPTPAAAPVENAEEDSDRYRTLSYGHPSLATIVPKGSGSQKTKSSSSRTRSSKLSQEAKPAQTKSQSTIQELDDTSSEDDIIIPSAQKRRKRATDTLESIVIPSPPKIEPSKTKKRSRRRSPSSDEDIVEQTEETPRPRRKLKRKAESSPIILIDSDSDDEPVLSSPVKRRRTFVPQDTPETPRASADQDDLDIEEDVRDLQDSVVKKNRTRGRLVESARDKRFKTLEAIRRKRAGQKEETDELEAGSGGDEGSPSKHGNQIDEEEEDDDGEDEGVDEQINPSDEDLDRYEDDFVLDDDNTLLGVPTEEIPFEFTRHAYKKPKDYFRDVVGWMIHNRLDPAFPRSDAMYEMAFMKLEDEVKGRAGSQLISSVWNADFRYALLARPHIEITSYPTEDCHSCDACNRSGHPASSDMKLYGKPYSLETLEPITDSDEDQSGQTSESDSDEEDSDKGADRDREGHLLPDEQKRFLLGRQCKHRAQLAHTLTHWRFHLYEWVVEYLKQMGHMSDEQVLRRNNMSQKRKTRNAIKVLESMVETGEIDKLWRDFHTILKSAREETA